MKPEEKTALLNEVIEMINGLKSLEQDGDVWLKASSIRKTIQSLLPKEEAIDWREASDEERMAHCEMTYKEGMIVKCAFIGRTNEIKNAKLKHGSFSFPSDIWCNNGNLCLYQHSNGKFAEIIPDSQIKEPIIHEVKSEPTQEIKAGVPVCRIGSDKKEYMVIHIDGEKAWLKAKNQNYGVIEDVKNIRIKPLEKTQEEMDRERADEIINSFFLRKSVSEEYRENYQSMLLEAINYGRKTKQD